MATKKLTRAEIAAKREKDDIEAAEASANLFATLNSGTQNVVDEMIDENLNDVQNEVNTVQPETIQETKVAEVETKTIEVVTEPLKEEVILPEPAVEEKTPYENDDAEETEEVVVEEPKDKPQKPKKSSSKPAKEKVVVKQNDSLSALKNIKQKKKGASRNMYLEADVNEAIDRICKETGAGVSATVNALLLAGIEVYDNLKDND